METEESSLPCSQQPVTDPYTEPDKSSSYFHVSRAQDLF
jgi:hypothetical protein